MARLTLDMTGDGTVRVEGADERTLCAGDLEMAIEAQRDERLHDGLRPGQDLAAVSGVRDTGFPLARHLSALPLADDVAGAEPAYIGVIAAALANHCQDADEGAHAQAIEARAEESDLGDPVDRVLARLGELGDVTTIN